MPLLEYSIGSTRIIFQKVIRYGLALFLLQQRIQMTHKYTFGYSTIPKDKWDRAFGRKKVESGVVTDISEDYITFIGPLWQVTGEAVKEYKMKNEKK